MSVIITGAGRSGTNMLLESLSASKDLKATRAVEDKAFFRRIKKYKENILTKCDVGYYNKDQFIKTMKVNPHLKVLWTIRHPRDMCMSKIRRGATFCNGGDCPVAADDATFEGCKKNMFEMLNFYKFITCSEFKDSIRLVRMENMILNIETELKSISEWLSIEYNHEMPLFYKRMRNNLKAKRYKTIDKSQVDMWKNWKNIYDGWLVNNFPKMEKLFKEVEPITKYFEYESNCNNI